MSRVSLFLSSLAVLAFALGLTGCPSGGESDQATPSPGPPAAAGHDEADEGHEHAEGEHEGHEHAEGEHEGHEHAEGMSTMSGGSEAEAALAELSEEDRALAVAQKTCPVSGEPLGAMGTPVKVTANGRDLFLCCEHCKDAFSKDPDKYLAKLDQ